MPQDSQARHDENPAAASSPAHMPVATKTLLWPGLIAAATFLAFAPSLQNDFVNWDDAKLLLNNPHYRGLAVPQLRWMFQTNLMGHYQPLTWITFGLDYVIWQMNPRGYHLTNVLLHLVNAMLLYRLASRLFALAGWRSAGELAWGSAVAALVFAVHPLRAESVAWVTERRDVLSGLFFLLTVLCYLRFVTSDDDARRLAYYVLSLVSYAASLLSKAAGVGLPLVLLALDWYPLRRWGRGAGSESGVWRRTIMEKLPYFGMAAIAALMALRAESHAETLAPLSGHGTGERLLQSAYALCFYIQKTLLPVGLVPLVPLPRQVSFFELRYIGSVVAVLLAAAVLFLKRARWGAAIVASVYYVIMLLPVIGLVQIGPQLVADRYSYLSCIGFAVLLGAGAIVAQRLFVHVSPLSPFVFRAVVLALLASLCLLARRQVDVWRNSETLWSRVLERFPDADMAHVGLAITLGEQGRVAEAIAHLKRAVELNPTWFEPHYDLGVALITQGKLSEASESLEKALELMPHHAAAWNDLGATRLQLGQVEPAERALVRAVALQPEFAMAHYNLAQLLLRQGRNREAIDRLRIAAEVAPRSPVFHENLAWLLATCPDDELRDGVEAVRIAEQASRQTGHRNPGCLDALAAAYAEVDRYDEAVQVAQAAVELARRAGNRHLAAEIGTRLELYRARRPYRAGAL